MITNARTAVLVTLPDGCDLAEIGDWIRDSFHRAAADGRESGVIRDVNGNTVGEWEVEPADDNDDAMSTEPTRSEVPVTGLRIGDRVLLDGDVEATVDSISPCLFGAFEVYVSDGDVEETLFLTHSADTVTVLR